MSVSNFSSLAGLELHLRTIPGRVGSGRVGWVQSDYKAISVQLQLQLPTGTELGNTDVVKLLWRKMQKTICIYTIGYL